MSISFEILGGAGQDNALLVRVDSGQAVHRLLFDCGEACLANLSFADVQAIDLLCFSHLHMDHVGGFDHFFRANFDRTAKPNVIYGPPATGAVMQHRFQGYLWNLHAQMQATWRVCEVHADRIDTFRFELQEAFAVAHAEEARPLGDLLIDSPDFTIATLTMDHNTPSLAYVMREKPRTNVDVSRLQALGLRPGPWLKQLKDARDPSEFIEINGTRHNAAALRESLVTVTPGDSIAYLTDFLMDDAALQRLETALQGCRIVVCESQYRHADLELAQRNCHMTSTLAARAAQRAGVQELVLFHLSQRYTPDIWTEMLCEAQAIFPAARFPATWQLDKS